MGRVPAHEEITDPADWPACALVWVVELPDSGYATPEARRARDDRWPVCHTQPARPRPGGCAAGRQTPRGAGSSAEAGTARGLDRRAGHRSATRPRDGRVWVLFGACDAVGWPAVIAVRRRQAVLPLVRHF
jgi:hypothetical protein